MRCLTSLLFGCAPLAGVGTAKQQLQRLIQLMAWLHAVLGQQQPEYKGTVVVPRAQRRDAQRRLGSVEERLLVPQGHGTVRVVWELGTA